MKHLTLLVTDLDPTLDAALVHKIEAACRNVRITASGYLVRGWGKPDNWDAADWRCPYRKFVRKLIPHAYVYGGGHHLAIHASPPPPLDQRYPEQSRAAGRCLFRIVEVKKLHPLACGRHWGDLPGRPCRKCSSGPTYPTPNSSALKDSLP